MLWLIENVEQITLSDVVPLFPCLSEARREKLASFRHEPSAVQSGLAELLLRHALREEYGLNELPAIETGKKGKPFFPDRPEIHFNLSHCKTAVACALAAAPVGVDVQEYKPLCRAARPLAAADERHSSKETRRDKQCLSAPPIYRILSEPERAWVEAGETPAEQDRRFTAVWTCKEAYGKKTGDGFLYDLRSTCFIPDKASWQQYDSLFFRLSREEYELTLCADQPMPWIQVCFEDISMR